MQVDNVILQALGIPYSEADTLPINLGLEIVRNKSSRRNAVVLGYFIVTLLDPFLGRKRKGCLEELKERGFAGVSSANDENANYCVSGPGIESCLDVETYFIGVGSFLLRTRRGLLTVLIALLA